MFMSKIYSIDIVGVENSFSNRLVEADELIYIDLTGQTILKKDGVVVAVCPKEVVLYYDEETEKHRETLKSRLNG